MQCYNCKHEWHPCDERDVYISSEIIDGQYTEFPAAICPRCGCENSIGSKSTYTGEWE